MINLLAALVPYAAVLIGMYILHNAWLTILLYYFGVIVFAVCRKPSDLWKMAGDMKVVADSAL